MTRGIGPIQNSENSVFTFYSASELTALDKEAIEDDIAYKRRTDIPEVFEEYGDEHTILCLEKAIEVNPHRRIITYHNFYYCFTSALGTLDDEDLSDDQSNALSNLVFTASLTFLSYLSEDLSTWTRFKWSAASFAAGGLKKGSIQDLATILFKIANLSRSNNLRARQTASSIRESQRLGILRSVDYLAAARTNEQANYIAYWLKEESSSS